MRVRARLRSLWCNLVHRERAEQALDDELRAYMELLAADYERRGTPPTAARRAARVAMGGVEQMKEATRDAWTGNALAVAARELRWALRALARAPGFVAIAVATLAIGIGGATAAFTIVNAALLQPLPAVGAPDRLVSAERVQPSTTLDDFSYPDYLDLRDRTTALAGLAAYNGTSVALDDRAGSARAWVSYVSGNFFSVLAVAPLRGRLIGPADAVAAGGAPVAVLAYGLWQSRFGGDSAVIGSRVRLNGHVFTIIGITPPGFVGAMRLHPMQLWIPVTMVQATTHGLSDDVFQSRAYGWLRFVGRLAAGRTVADAQRDLAAIAARLAAAYPTNRGRGVHVYAGAGMTADERADESRLPRLLAIGVALLLLMACANVASLTLVRAASRRRELATRLALGASRAALVRQLCIEGAVVAAGAAALGIAIAHALVRSAAIVGAVVSVSVFDPRTDWRVLGVALAVTVFTAVAVSVLPAVQVSRTQAGLVLKDGTGGAVRRRSAGQRALVVLQVTLSLVMLAAAGMIYSAFQRTLRVDPGFDARGLAFALVDARPAGYDSTMRPEFYRQVLARAAADPSFAGAALTSTIPPQRWATRVSVFRAGEEPSPAVFAGHEFELGLRVYWDAVSPDLFTVMRIPILRGRAFRVSDDAQHPPVAIVSRRLARELWPGQEPVGQYLTVPESNGALRVPMQVVGVAGDTRHVSLVSDPPFLMYVPFMQHPDWNVFLLARGRGDVPPSATALRRVVAAVDPTITVLGGTPLRSSMLDEVRPQRTASAWIGVFGIIALLLAAIGLYGVVAQGVLQRTRELAVRSALGATPRGLLALVLGDGLRLAAAGALLGTVGAVLALRWLRSTFTSMDTVDLGAAAGAVLVLAAAMLAATWLPARRAARLDPAVVLRSD